MMSRVPGLPCPAAARRTARRAPAGRERVAAAHARGPVAPVAPLPASGRPGDGGRGDARSASARPAAPRLRSGEAR